MSLGYIAQMWWCGDDICDCTEPQICEIRERTYLGNLLGEIVWRGTFHSESNPKEDLDQRKELLDAARKWDVENLKEIEDEYSK